MDYFLGDIHDMDKNIITYFHRPFKDVQEMHNAFVNNWNQTVSNQDKGYIVGDVGDIEILKELNGEIIVVCGNHDDYDALRTRYPNMEIYKYPIMVGGLWLSHEPITFMPPECPYLNIHGHLHNLVYGLEGRLWEDGNRYFNVSAERLDYKPISKTDIAMKMGYK
jgi:calcineurin-like phosphoesterase family protein